ncbi:MAG: flavodoxin family protein [Rhodococcus sp. (in: high G+C Gram-positive bacteria)]
MKPKSTSLIVCVSGPHGNTRKIADAIATVLDAEVSTPDLIDPARIADYDLVGFASGIYLGKHHRELLSFVASLPIVHLHRAFTCATSGFADSPRNHFSRSLAVPLHSRGFEISGAFSCRAKDTFFPFAVFGGIRKSHPDDADVERARLFAEELRTPDRSSTSIGDAR